MWLVLGHNKQGFVIAGFLKVTHHSCFPPLERRSIHMPVCEVCDGDKFDVVNGLYFCQECNTQSQEIIQEEIEYAQSDASSHRMLKARKKKAKRKMDHGKPWYTAEGFQVILKVQVEALIKMGCTPKLDEVVRQIWMKYIHISGLACIDPDIPQEDEFLRSFRDEYLSGIFGDLDEEDDLLPTVKTAVVKLRISSQRKKRKRNSSKDELSETGSTFTENDVTNDASSEKGDAATREEEWFSLASNAETSESEGELSPTKRKHYRRPDKSKKVLQSTGRKGWSHPNYLNHRKLLVILFIAVQWCKEIVTLGDLLTWIKQGYLPFADSVKLLLPHMKLGDMDMGNFHMKYIPSYATVVNLSEKMMRSLSMPRMPDVDIMKFVTRYVVQLNLPHAFVPFIKMLIPRFNYTRTSLCGFQHYVPDLAAFGLVIVALKLLYGLDDNREWNMDEGATSCQHDSSLPGTKQHTCEPFLWRRWSEYHRRRRGVARRNPAHCFLTRDSEEIDDVHSHQEHWNNVVFAPHLVGKDRPGKSKGSRELREQMKTKCRVFEKICEEQGSAEEMERRGAGRDLPYVMEKPSKEDDMSRCCICEAVRKFTSDEDTPYVWYNAYYTRAENRFVKRDPTPLYKYTDDSTKMKEPVFHDSYQLLMRLCVEFTCAPLVAAQEAIQNLERAVVCPHLRMKKIT